MQGSPILPRAFAALVLGLVAGCGSTEKPMTATPAAKVNPAKIQTLAKAPTPSTNAAKQASIGKDHLVMKTANAAGDTDVSWVVDIDMDGDGDTEKTTLLWDDEDGVLYAYAETEVPCEMGGGSATVSLLIAVNAKGNSRNRPEGSGFYVEYFDASECSAQKAGLYGAKFNAQGKTTEWGAVVLDEANDDIKIVTPGGAH